MNDKGAADLLTADCFGLQEKGDHADPSRVGGRPIICSPTAALGQRLAWPPKGQAT